MWFAAQMLVLLGTLRSFVFVGALSAAYLTVDLLRVPAWRDEVALFGQALQLDPDSIEAIERAS